MDYGIKYLSKNSPMSFQPNSANGPLTNVMIIFCWKEFLNN